MVLKEEVKLRRIWGSEARRMGPTNRARFYLSQIFRSRYFDGSGRPDKRSDQQHHPTPENLIDTSLSSLFVDGFTERFRQIREEVLSGSSPRECTFLVNFRGHLELRRCRILKSQNGLIVINHSNSML